MDILVLNDKFESIKVIDDYESEIWTDRYNEQGDFELILPMKVEILDYLKKDYYLWLKESDHLMIIDQLNTISDIEDGNKLQVLGVSLESILNRRVIWGQKVVTGNFQDAIKTLLNENIISPTIADRKISNFIFEASTDTTITGLTINAQYYGENLYDIITSLCQQVNIGYKIILNSSNQFVFSFYNGTDRSYDQIANPYVIFSPKFENIISSEYKEHNDMFKNVAFIGGEGEGSARKTATTGTATGIARREYFSDAGDISSTTDSGTISTAEYQKLLIQRGTEDLESYKESKSFTGEAETSQMFKYGEDFFVGDIVQVADEYGHEGKAYVTEIIFSHDKSGLSIYPTFSMIQEEEESS